MKKFGFFLPIILVLLFSMLGTRMLASGSIRPVTLILISVVVFGIALMSRPKAAASKPVSDIAQKVRGEFARDAFADDAQLGAKFQAALKDYSGNMPKAALGKLQKLAPQCTGDKEIYAVALATATVLVSLHKPKDAIREYVRALGLHPSSSLAMELGSCYQRLGELEKARDTYQYALDLDGGNIEAISAIATTYVADRKYQMGLEEAMKVLEKNENHASALATAAICHGLLGDPLMSRHFTDRAVANGYRKDKITQTIDALKKR